MYIYGPEVAQSRGRVEAGVSPSGPLYIFLYICICLCIYVYRYIYIFIYKYIFIFTYIFTYIYIYIYTHIHMYICIYTYICIYIYMHICICNYAYIYIDPMSHGVMGGVSPSGPNRSFARSVLYPPHTKKEREWTRKSDSVCVCVSGICHTLIWHA